MISKALLIPDMLLLVSFFALTIAYLGGLVAEAMAKQMHGKAFQKLVSKLKDSPNQRIRMEDVPAASGLAAKAFRRATVDREKLMDDLQLESERILSRLMLGHPSWPHIGIGRNADSIRPRSYGHVVGRCRHPCNKFGGRLYYDRIGSLNRRPLFCHAFHPPPMVHAGYERY